MPNFILRDGKLYPVLTGEEIVKKKGNEEGEKKEEGKEKNTEEEA